MSEILPIWRKTQTINQSVGNSTGHITVSVIAFYIYYIHFSEALHCVGSSDSLFLDLYINSTKSTWEDASRSCSLLGSDRSPSYDVNAQEIPVLEPRYRGGRPQAGRILYWIGAAANFTPWFELLGREDVVLI